MICFNLFFKRLSPSHNTGHEFDELILVNSSYFRVFLIDFSISITFFNIRFIEN